MMINTDLDLPVGWRVARFDQVLKRVERKVILDDATEYDCVGVRWYGQGAFVRERLLGMNIARKQQWLINQGDIVYNKLFAWKGAFAIADALVDGCIVSDKFPTYATDESLLDPRYLAYYFRAPQLARQAQDLSKGAAAISKLTLNPPQFWDLTIPLPPLAEQRRIVARIEALAARIAEARGLRRQAMEEVEALLASVIDAAFSLNDNWKEERVEDLCEAPQYGYTESAVSEPVGPRFLRITDIQDGSVNWQAVPYCECSEPNKYLLMPNDLLFARTGATTGKSFLIRSCPEPTVFASYLIRLRIRQHVTPDYLYWYFQSPTYWQQISSERTGTGQPNVNGKKLANIIVPVAPQADQRRVVAYLDDLQARTDALKRLQAETAAELDALLPSILDQAFKGEL